MRSLSKAGLLLGATAALLVAGAGAASADSNAVGIAENSPGVLSGNVVQIPVDVPVNVCGNSVNVIGLLNPASGNTCSNGSGSEQGAFHHDFHVNGWHHIWIDPSWDDHSGPHC